VIPINDARYSKGVKDEQINHEISRLNKIYKDIPKNQKSLIEGLIKRASYMRVSLEEMEFDLSENGYIELFSQSEKTEPYERERPVARLYNTLNKNYQTIMKQLAEFLPEEKPEQEQEDEFIKYIRNKGKK